jgi:iron complex transport system permease protein
MRMARSLVALTGLAVLSLAGFAFAAAVGSVSLGWGELAATLLGSETGMAQSLVWELRLPRAASAFVVGGLLALAGALMQVLLRNPLADPYVLGISGGAAVGALGALILGFGSFAVSGGALGGALLSMVLVFGLSHGPGGFTPMRLLLNGIVVASGWGAVISFILAVGPSRELRGMLFWLMGDLAGSGGPGWAWPVLPLGLAIAWAIARPLNLLGRGEIQATVLGVDVVPIRTIVFLLASLLTATAVTLAGSVGFVGLVVPHILRLIIGNDHRVLLPATVLGGGSLLLVADTLARTVLAPQQLPVGVLSALIGVPLFLILLYHGRTTSAP